MSKVKFLVCMTILVGGISAFLATKARVRYVIYTRDPVHPEICNMTVFGKSMVALPAGSFRATAIVGMSCVNVTTFDLDD